MDLKPGMKIKIFPETNAKSYQKLIRDCGFTSTIYKDRIIVGDPLGKIDSLKLGKLIKKKRTKKKLTEAELAEKLAIRKETVHDYEIGQKQPRKDILDDIKIALNITEEEIKKCHL